MIARLNWAWMPVALLGSLTGGLALMISIAVNDPSFAVEPSYHQHALQWDLHRAELERSRDLGWHSTWQLSPTDGAPGPEAQAPIRVNLTDATGQPLAGAQVSVKAFANARAAQLQTSTLHPTEAGSYEGVLSVGRHGLWQLELSVVRAGDRFSEQLTVEFSRAGEVLSSRLHAAFTQAPAPESEAP